MKRRIATVLCTMAWIAGPAHAQQTQQLVVQPVAPQQVFVNDQNAQQTREQLRQLLRQYPPSVSRVLALDPSLASNQNYLTTYPQLAAFLAQQPEVAHNPAFFFGTPDDNGNFNNNGDPQAEAVRMWRGMLQGTAIFAVFLTVASFLAWLIKTVIDYRRWLHVSKVQTEAHNKLLDRLTGHEDLLAYIQTPAGRRFLESAPVLDPGPRSMGAPIARVLWSAQIGMVLAFAGLGINFASNRVNEYAAAPLSLIGILAMALGLGFVISAALAYVLSKRLGLLEPRPSA